MWIGQDHDERPVRNALELLGSLADLPAERQQDLVLRPCADRARVPEGAFGVERLDLADQFVAVDPHEVVGTLDVPQVGFVHVAVAAFTQVAPEPGFGRIGTRVHPAIVRRLGGSAARTSGVRCVERTALAVPDRVEWRVSVRVDRG